MKKIDKINWGGYPPYKQSVYDQEELTALELAGRTTHKVNELTDAVNNTAVELEKKEDSSRITNNRKLSPSGNFTGTWHGLPLEKTSQGVEASLASLNELQTEPLLMNPTTTPKLVIQASTVPLYYVIQKRYNGDGYIQYFLERHVGSGVEGRDYAVNYELLRVIRVRYLSDVFVYQHNDSDRQGTWDTWSETFPSGRGGFRIPYRRNNNAGDFIEFTTTVPSDGKFNIYFYMTGSSSTDVDISIDGDIVENISLATDQPQRYIHEMKTRPGNRTIRITNNTNNYAYVGGLNFSTLEDLKNYDTIDNYNYYSINGDTDYISNNGSSDYAFIDDRNGKYFGSYHGGETLISEELIVDGISRTMELHDFIVGKNIVFNQVTNLIDRYTMHTSMNFSADGTFHQSSIMTGESTPLRTAYTALTTVDSSFDEVIYPVYYKIVLPEDNDKRIKLGRTNKIVQRNSQNNRIVTSIYTLFNEEYNSEGGAFIRVNGRHYNKPYYGKVVQSPRNIESLHFQTIRIFE